MNLDERIKSHLEASTSHIQTTSRLESIMAEGRNRRVRSRMAGVLGAAAAITAIVTVAAVILPGGGPITDPTNPGIVETGPVTTARPPDTTAPVSIAGSGEARGLLIADLTGLRAVTMTNETELDLQSEALGGEVGIAFPDTRGGLVFQHVTTPEPWAPGSILHLAAGASQPEPIAEPGDGDGALVPVGLARTADGSRALIYLSETQGEGALSVMRYSFDSGESGVVRNLDGDQDMGVGGHIIWLMDRSDRQCATLTLIDMNSGDEIPAPVDCLPTAASVAVGDSGANLALLTGDDLEIVAIGSGASTLSRSIPGAYMVTSGPGGWVVRAPEEAVVISESGTTSLPLAEAGWAVPYVEPFDLRPVGPSASGSTEGACVPTDGNLVDQALPAPVADIRAEIFHLAAACDYDGLADLALDSATHLTAGGDGEDPASMWIEEGETSIEPLGTMATILNTTPAFDNEAGIWAWPAVHLEPGNDEVWAELEAELGSEMVEMLRPGGEGYYGYRVGITADGQWQYFVSGD